jgi:hypothetical protein
MKFHITVEVPDGEILDYLRRLREDPIPPAPEPPAEPRASRTVPAPDDRPFDGRTLLGWANKRALMHAVFEYRDRHALPEKVIDWDPDQVADCYAALMPLAAQDTARPRRGSSAWGGAPAPARPDRISPK